MSFARLRSPTTKRRTREETMMKHAFSMPGRERWRCLLLGVHDNNEQWCVVWPSGRGKDSRQWGSCTDEFKLFPPSSMSNAWMYALRAQDSSQNKHFVEVVSLLLKMSACTAAKRFQRKVAWRWISAFLMSSSSSPLHACQKNVSTPEQPKIPTRASPFCWVYLAAISKRKQRKNAVWDVIWFASSLTGLVFPSGRQMKRSCDIFWCIVLVSMVSMADKSMKTPRRRTRFDLCFLRPRRRTWDRAM